MGKLVPLEVHQGAQICLIGAKDHGEEHLVVVGVVVVVVVAPGVLEDTEDSREISEGGVLMVEK